MSKRVKHFAGFVGVSFVLMSWVWLMALVISTACFGFTMPTVLLCAVTFGWLSGLLLLIYSQLDRQEHYRNATFSIYAIAIALLSIVVPFRMLDVYEVADGVTQFPVGAYWVALVISFIASAVVMMANYLTKYSIWRNP